MHLWLPLMLAGATLHVGDGRPYARIEDAVRDARAGDTVLVHPSSKGYARTAVRVDKPRLRLAAAGKVRLDGAGFEYSGEGKVPRAVVEFAPEAEAASVEGFEIVHAHNRSHNGAGVRINAARKVTVKDCAIHDNDMGIMSNGANGDPHAGENQSIEGCRIYSNGDMEAPGYNHNLYLGGTSATLERCEIYSAVTGHNVKSRLHYLVVRYCHVYGGDNRQFDLVDAWDTERPHSNAVLIGNLIRSNPAALGNRNVIHFGAERGVRDGRIYLINNTIVTPHQAPVLLLSSPKASAEIVNSIVFNPSESIHPLSEGSGVQVHQSWISPGYRLGKREVRSLPSQGVNNPGFVSPTSYNIPHQPFGWVSSQGLFFDGNGRRHRAVAKMRLIDGNRWVRTRDRFIGAG